MQHTGFLERTIIGLVQSEVLESVQMIWLWGQVPVQLDLFMNEQRREKQEKLDRAVDDIRRRFGYHSVQRAFMYQDKILAQLNAKEHTIHPQAYFHG